jgi:ATP-dependent exoDNAse (exonuclease V) alpha subunit
MNHQVHKFAIKDQKAFEYRCVATYAPNLENNIPTLGEITALHQLPSSVSQKKECLANYIEIGIGCRVRCVRNKGTQIGIFNGAMGTVVGFCFEQSWPQTLSPAVKDFAAHVGREIPIVLVQMDSLKGIKTKDNIIPFAAQIDDDYPLRTNGKVFYRRQLPLEISFASTVHKYQGLTAQHDVIVQPTRKPFAFGLEYVAISRTTSLDKLHLLQHLETKHFDCKRFSKILTAINEEYERCRSLNQEVNMLVDDSSL